MPKISIVLPSFNGEKYIRESLDSIISQKFQDWELIVVDDSSTDNTMKIVNEYADNDSRIRLIHNEKNQKLPESLNIGFRTTRGKYLTWTSDDNTFESDALEKMATFLDEHTEFDMVRADYQYIDDMGKIIGRSAPFEEKKLYAYNCIGACFLYRRVVMENVGEYARNKFLVEDYDYWLRILLSGSRIGNIEKQLYRYRLHPGSLTTKRAQEIRYNESRLLAEKIEDIYEKLCIDNESLSTFFIKTLYVKNIDISKYQMKIIQRLPLLNRVRICNKDENVFAYGAGDYGKKAFRLLGDHILSYVDKDPQKVGTSLYGKDIISLDCFLSKRVPKLLIALSPEKIWNVIKELAQYGITDYLILPENI